MSGRIIDKESGEPLAYASVQLLKIGNRDTTLVSGGTTTAEGRFSLVQPATGTYLLKTTYLGYKPLLRTVPFHTVTFEMSTLERTS